MKNFDFIQLIAQHIPLIAIRQKYFRILFLKSPPLMPVRHWNGW